MLDKSGARSVVIALGIFQILAWGSSFYLLSVLAPEIAAKTGWKLPVVLGGLSFAMLVAGLVSPRIGQLIHREGGRPVLAASSLLFAAGLMTLALAPTPPVYMAGWLLIGLGMGCGLYDPAFATLGRHYGHEARRMITAVTLFGGFASTVCWPLSAFLLEQYGWRTTCAVYAALHAFAGLPCYVALLPKRPPIITDDAPLQGGTSGELPAHRQRVAFILLGVILSLGAAILSLVSAHLLVLLQTRGLDLAAAVALGAIVGPSQVAARVVEVFLGKRFHPTWSMFAGVVLVAVGLVLMALDAPLPAVALIAYGAGNGISSIVRGTVPLVLFGQSQYAVLMGRLGLPILVSMAAAPFAGALLIESVDAPITYSVLGTCAVLNVLLAASLVGWCLGARVSS